MNPNKSIKDFKPTQPSDEVVERIHNLHGYVINTSITSVQPYTCTDRYLIKVTTNIKKYEYIYILIYYILFVYITL